ACQPPRRRARAGTDPGDANALHAPRREASPHLRIGAQSRLARAVLEAMAEENDAMIHIRRWTGWVPLFTFLGCAAPPVPAEKLASAEAGIRAAAEVGAEGVPQAALHLKLARDQVEQAKGLVQRGDRDRATVVLDRAEADAALSLTLARESAARA